MSNINIWTGSWIVKSDKKSNWDNTIITLIKSKRKNILIRKEYEDAQIWKIKVNNNNYKSCIYTVVKKNGRMKTYVGHINDKNNSILWKSSINNKKIDTWHKMINKNKNKKYK